MVSRRAAFLSAALIVPMVVAGYWLWVHLPDGVPIAVHFDAAGQPNGVASPALALFIVPAVAAATWVLFAILPRIDPRGANLARSEKAYGTIWLSLTLMLCALQGIVIAATMSRELSINRLIVGLVGALLVVLGNVLGKIRWNYSLGIRTPWTLADERVWDRTHRFGGWVFVGGGVLLLVAAFAAPDAIPLPLLVLPILLGVSLATIVQSYLLSRRKKAE